MIRLYFAFFTLFSYDFIRAQNPNDNCENAIDITSEIFNSVDFPEWCNSINGIAYLSYGFVEGYFDHPTVDALVYGSQECSGYKTETTNEYPDI